MQPVRRAVTEDVAMGLALDPRRPDAGRGAVAGDRTAIRADVRVWRAALPSAAFTVTEEATTPG